MKGFDVKKSTRNLPQSTNIPEVVVVDDQMKHSNNSNGNPIVQSLADNMSDIIALAQSYLDIQKGKVATKAQIALLEEKRRMLESESETYVKKLKAETDSFITKVEVFRQMLRDFYTLNTGNMSGEEFGNVMKTILDSMKI